MMGQHVLLNVYDVDPRLLEDYGTFLEFIRSLLSKSQAVVVNDCGHKFEPGGYTYLALLSTSHFSIHTWPEHGCAALDMFTCGDIQIDVLSSGLLEYFSPQSHDLKKLTR